MKTKLLQVAFDLASGASGHSTSAEAKIVLQQRFPDLDFPIIADAYREAQRLLEVAYEVADQLREGSFSRREAIQLLRERCTGFSDGVYGDALARGLHASR